MPTISRQDIDVLSNDDYYGFPITVSIVSQPAQGLAQVDQDNTLNWTGPASFAGQLEFTYSICLVEAPTNCDSANVTIWVQIIALPVSATFIQGSTTYRKINVTRKNPGGSTYITYPVVVGTPSHGGTVVVGATDSLVQYTPFIDPPNSFAGVETFLYTVTVVGYPTNYATNVVNCRILISVGNYSVTTSPGSSVTTNVLNENLGSGVGSSVVVVEDPTNGSIVDNDAQGSIIYQPNLGFVGTDSFRYQLCANAPVNNCGVGTVTVEVENSK